MAADKPAPTPSTRSIITKTRTTINRQKYDLAKFLRFLFAVPPKAYMQRNIKPTIGILNRSSYPKYPYILMGVYSAGIC